MLFRQVLDYAADTQRLPRRNFSDKGLEDGAASELRRTVAIVKQKLADLGRQARPPWCSDEKAAALAAWVALAARPRA